MLRDVSKSTLNIMEAGATDTTCGRDGDGLDSRVEEAQQDMDYAIDHDSVIPDSECEQEVLNTDYIGGVSKSNHKHGVSGGAVEDTTFSDLLEMDINFAPGSMEVGELRTEEVTPEVEECFRGFERQMMSHVSHSHVSHNSMLGSYPIQSHSHYESIGQSLGYFASEELAEVEKGTIQEENEEELVEEEEGQSEEQSVTEQQQSESVSGSDGGQQAEASEAGVLAVIEDEVRENGGSDEQLEKEIVEGIDSSNVIEITTTSPGVTKSETAQDTPDNGAEAEDELEDEIEDEQEAEDEVESETTPKATRKESEVSVAFSEQESSHINTSHFETPQAESPQTLEEQHHDHNQKQATVVAIIDGDQDVSMMNVSMDRTHHDISMAEATTASNTTTSNNGGDTTMTANETDDSAAAQTAHTTTITTHTAPLEDTASQATVSRESSAPVGGATRETSAKPEETEGDTTVTVTASVTPENTGLVDVDGDVEMDETHQEEVNGEDTHEEDEIDAQEDHDMEGDVEEQVEEEGEAHTHAVKETVTATTSLDTTAASQAAVSPVASFPALPMDTAKLSRESKPIPGEVTSETKLIPGEVPAEKRLIPGEKPSAAAAAAATKATKLIPGEIPLAKRPLLDETPVSNAKLIPGEVPRDTSSAPAPSTSTSKILQPTPRVALTMKPPESLVSSVRASSQPPRQLTPIPDLSHSDALPEDPNDQARLALARKRPLPKRPQGRKISHETTLELQNFELSCKGLSDHYRLLDKVGEGTFSSVYLAEDIHYDLKREFAARKKQSQSSSHWKSPPLNSKKRIRLLERSNADIHRGPLVAIKRIYVTSSPKRILNEIKILDALSGYDNISPLLKVMRHEDQILAVLPYFEHQDFRSLYKTGSKTDIRIYITQLCQALKFVHSKDIIHRDIKPTNFLYDRHRRYGVLVDFGLAEVQSFSTSNPCVCVSQESQKRILGSAWELKPKGSYEKNDVRSGRRSNRAGTRGFRAPEVLFKCTCQTTQIDMWSVGVILLSFLCKTLPFFMSHDDADALVELCSIFGRQAMHQTGLLHGAFLELQIPKLRSTGLSFERVLLQAGCPEEWARDPVVIDFLSNTMKLDHHHRFSAEKALAHEFCQRAYEEDDYVDV